MSRTSLALLPVLLGASVASADTYTIGTIQPPPLVLLPAAHLLHAHCHFPGWDQYSECAQIRLNEALGGDAYAKSSPQDLIDANNQHKTGHRDLADQTKVKGTTSDSSFTAVAATRRFTPPALAGASSRPELEESGSVPVQLDSCEEWVYKRYYMVNRYVDTIGGYVTARNYPAAVNAILGGIPSAVQWYQGPTGQLAVARPKACAPLQSAPLVDFDGAPIAPFGLGTGHANFDPITPKWTGSQPRNEFMAMSQLVAPPLAAAADTRHTVAWWNAYIAAYNASQVNAYRYDGTGGEFARASALRNNSIITGLSPAESDDIAVRKIAIRKAGAAIGAKYGRCLMKRFRDLTATANYGPGTWQNLEQYIADPQQGWTYPVDFDEIALQVQLFNSATAGSALSTVLGADPTSLLQSGAWARSSTGSLLRALNLLDATALSSAVGTTSYTVLSYSSLPSGCDISAELDAYRELVVTEWNRPSHGCYNGDVRCDFNAKVFVQDIMARLQDRTAGEDEAKHICLGTTSDDWVSGATTVAPEQRALTAKDFETWLKNRRSELFGILLNTPTESNLPGSIGDLKAGGSDWGNGTFGAGYSYRGEWAVNVSSRGVLPLTSKSCAVLGGRVDGQLNAYATGFGYRKNLIDAGLTAQTAQPNQPATLSAHANILGSDLFTPIENQALQPSYTDDDENTQSFTLATAYVTVGPFPVKVSVDVGFDWGYHMKFGYTQSPCAQKPTLGVTGELAPYAGTNASVSAGIDLFVVGVGIRFTLTLVSATLPFDASVIVGPNPADNNNWTVTAKSNLALDLTELAGKVSIFITTFGATVMELELFSWPGLHQHFDLWHDESVFPFAGFSLFN